MTLLLWVMPRPLLLALLCALVTAGCGVARADWIYREWSVQGWVCRIEFWITQPQAAGPLLEALRRDLAAVAATTDTPESPLLAQLLQRVQPELAVTGGVTLPWHEVSRGLAVDRAIDVLAAHGVQQARIEVAGVVRLAGDRFGQPWQVSLPPPVSAQLALRQRSYGVSRNAVVLADTALRAAMLATLADTRGAPATLQRLRQSADSVTTLLGPGARVLHGPQVPLNVR